MPQVEDGHSRRLLACGRPFRHGSRATGMLLTKHLPTRPQVPVANLIGEENKGFSYIMRNFNHER